ncbi:MAG: GTPase Era [Candidatus Gastranaerophilales bacterium]|nr:GTPase Era [Candidatus Gastranaerophilales bacterium]
MKKKTGFVAIIGRPNVGKSTLLNKILGQKIVIATDKPQTTRRRIKGIHTTDKGQIIFIDTPGIYKPWDKFGELLFEEAKLSVPDADVILFVVDASEEAGKGDKWIANNILNTEIPVIIVCNKVDNVKNTEKRDSNVNSYKLLFEKNYPLVKISAKTGRNIDTLIDNIYRKLPQGEPIYDEDDLTDETMRKIAAETIREKILLSTKDEIPHSVAVIIEQYKEEEDIDKIYATIVVEHDSQKMILIGKNGQMVKKIGTEARLELEKLADKKIFLDLNVKVIKNWRKTYKNPENLL